MGFEFHVLLTDLTNTYRYMTTLQLVADWGKFIGFALAIWNGIKLAFTVSANAGTRIGKKVGNANKNTEGAIEYTNRAMKSQLTRVAIFGGIGVVCLIIGYIAK